MSDDYFDSKISARIDNINFSFFSSDDVRRISVCEVRHSQSVDILQNPLPNGALDPRMGPTDPYETCPTCELSSKHCPGHFGRIELAFPMMHPLLFTDMIRLSRCMCSFCGRLRFARREAARFSLLFDALARGDVVGAAALLHAERPVLSKNKRTILEEIFGSYEASVAHLNQRKEERKIEVGGEGKSERRDNSSSSSVARVSGSQDPEKSSVSAEGEEEDQGNSKRHDAEDEDAASASENAPSQADSSELSLNDAKINENAERNKAAVSASQRRIAMETERNEKLLAAKSYVLQLPSEFPEQVREALKVEPFFALILYDLREFCGPDFCVSALPVSSPLRAKYPESTALSVAVRSEALRLFYLTANSSPKCKHCSMFNQVLRPDRSRTKIFLKALPRRQRVANKQTLMKREQRATAQLVEEESMTKQRKKKKKTNSDSDDDDDDNESEEEEEEERKRKNRQAGEEGEDEDDIDDDVDDAQQGNHFDDSERSNVPIVDDDFNEGMAMSQSKKKKRRLRASDEESLGVDSSSSQDSSDEEDEFDDNEKDDKEDGMIDDEEEDDDIFGSASELEGAGKKREAGSSKRKVAQGSREEKERLKRLKAVNGSDILEGGDNDGENDDEDERARTAEIITPFQLRKQLRQLFQSEPLLMRHLYGKRGSADIFFLECIAVPPNRFRRETVSASGADGRSRNPLTSILELLIVRMKSLEESFISSIKDDHVSEEDDEGDNANSNDGGDGSSASKKRPRDRATGAFVSARMTPEVVNRWVSAQQMVNFILDVPGGMNKQAGLDGVKHILEKKEGLLRSNMMGKRVDFAARSVISPDPMLAPDEVGVPVEFARELTFPEPVSGFNVKRLKQAVRRGANRHPGANFIRITTKAAPLNLRRDRYSKGIAGEKARVFQANSLAEPASRYGPSSAAKKSASTSSAALAAALASATGSAVAPDNLEREISSAMADTEELERKEQRVVWRHLCDGDMLLVNRQPTLHKPSIMAHRVRVLPSSTGKERVIRLHYANCSTYNADFDGDEMNMHFPQDLLGQAEARVLASAVNQFVVPKDGSPLRGLIQDSIVAGVMLTQLDTFLDRATFQQLLWAGLADLHRGTASMVSLRIDTPPPAIQKPSEMWTGKQVISSLLEHVLQGMPPLSFLANTRLPSKVWKQYSEEAVVRVVDNHLLTGVLDKAQLGATKYGLLHACHEIHGPENSARLLAALGRLLTVYLQQASFSCGMDDLTLSPSAERLLAESLQASADAGDEAAREQIKNDLDSVSTTSMSTEEAAAARLDAAVTSTVTQSASDAVQKALGSGLSKPFPVNRFSLMTLSGAKGSQVNHSQISCMLGQQELEGRRVPVMRSGRTLPCFVDDDCVGGARPGGFVIGRFLSGVRPQDYFFHCMAGREGLVDTAVKTSRSGYLQRCLVKHLESLVVSYDGSVRSSADGSIVQFNYGDDGIDVSRTGYLSKFPFFVQNRKSLANERTLGASASPVQNWSESMKTVGGEIRDRPEVESGAVFDDPLISVKSPFLYQGVVSESFAESLDQFTSDHFSYSVVTGSNDRNSSCDSVEEAEIFAREMLRKWRHSLAQPGEAVGMLAAQSLGEPSTQMTLNTFHLAGRGDVNVTLGIPRLRELLMTGSRNQQTPMMSIPLLPETGSWPIEKKLAAAQRVVGSLDQIRLHELIESRKIVESVEGNAEELLYSLELRLLPEEVYANHISKKQVLSKIKSKLAARIKRDLKASMLLKGLGKPGAFQLIRSFEESPAVNEENDTVSLDLAVPVLPGRPKVPVPRVIDESLQKLIVLSTKGVTRAVVSREQSSRPGVAPIVQTEGINLEALRSLPDDLLVDLNRVQANSVHDVCDVYGIEAGRAQLMNEVAGVFGAYGISIDARHLSLLADHMTFSGDYRGCNRMSFSANPSPISSMSFETTVGFLKAASLRGDDDNLHSASGRVFIGATMLQGTGSFDVFNEIK